MHFASLALWILAAAGGSVLLAAWLSRGGLQQRKSERTRFPPALIFGHAGLAALGLALWIVYVLTDNHMVARVAFGLVAAVVALGLTMFVRWRGRPPREVRSEVDRPAEDHFPSAIVYGHGLLGAATLALVLLTAFELVG